MKYEIIKGSEKDFEGAPEWCTHVSKSIESGERAWEMDAVVVIGNKYKWKRLPEPEMDYVHSAGLALNIIAERRPITEPVVNQQLTTEWDGDGLPPVGTLCEYHANYIGSHAQYEECEIIAHFDGEGERLAAYVYTQFDGTRLVGQGTAKSFRPIRSPEDVARDEAIKAMREALGHAAGLIEVSNIYRAIAAGKIPCITKTPTVSELMRVTENATREDCEAIVKMLSGK